MNVDVGLLLHVTRTFPFVIYLCESAPECALRLHDVYDALVTAVWEGLVFCHADRRYKNRTDFGNPS